MTAPAAPRPRLWPVAVFAVVVAAAFSSASFSPRASRILTDATEGRVYISCDRARGQCVAHNHGWAAGDGTSHNLNISALRSVDCEAVPNGAGAVHLVFHSSTRTLITGEALDPAEQASQREAAVRVNAFLADPAQSSVAVSCDYGSAPNLGGLIVGGAVLVILGAVIAYAHRKGAQPTGR
jgi:hypothetical protein